MTQLDLDGYLDRIGYAGSLDPTPRVLDKVIAHHTNAIPFENLDPFLGTPNRIDLESLQRKLVSGGRGGYCYEHNLLLRAVLLRLGFGVTGLSARVRWGVPDDVATPRSHMLLRVTAGDEERIADVGFGGMVLTTSLALRSSGEQTTPLEPFRLVEEDGSFALQSFVAAEWRALYRFDLQPQLPIDYEASNWYTSTAPESKFVTSLIAARATPDRRHALAGRRLTTRVVGQPPEQRILGDTDELRDALTELFRINTSALDLDAAFAKAGAPI